MTILQLKRHIDRKFATKKELQRFATKDDLQRFATKDDLQRFATKDDLTALEGRMNARLGEMTRQFESLSAKVDGFFRYVQTKVDGFEKVDDEHERRLHDLESQARH